jgi:hypothetical protein
MKAKTQYLEGRYVYHVFMKDPYPVTNTFLLLLVDMRTGSLRNAMSAAMRKGPKRLSLMRVFRKGIISICDMYRLWDAPKLVGMYRGLHARQTQGFRQLCYYLMHSPGHSSMHHSSHVIECLDSGIVSLRDVERLWGISSGLVCVMFAADVGDNKQLRYACVSDLQQGRVDLLQLENLWLYGDYTCNKFPPSAHSLTTCSDICHASCRELAHTRAGGSFHTRYPGGLVCAELRARSAVRDPRKRVSLFL